MTKITITATITATITTKILIAKNTGIILTINIYNKL